MNRQDGINLYTPANIKIANLAQGTPLVSARYLIDLADWFKTLARRTLDERARRNYTARSQALMARARQMSYRDEDRDEEHADYKFLRSYQDGDIQKS